MRNTFKMETTIDYTYWDLNCKHVIPHRKKHNKLERMFKRKNRRKIKRKLDKLRKECYN